MPERIRDDEAVEAVEAWWIPSPRRYLDRRLRPLRKAARASVKVGPRVHLDALKGERGRLPSRRGRPQNTLPVVNLAKVMLLPSLLHAANRVKMLPRGLSD